MSKKRSVPTRGREAGAENKLKNPGRNAKVTLYLRPDQIETIEEIQLAERKRTGLRPDKSKLIQEAVDLLREKYLA